MTWDWKSLGVGVILGATGYALFIDTAARPSSAVEGDPSPAPSEPLAPAKPEVNSAVAVLREPVIESVPRESNDHPAGDDRIDHSTEEFVAVTTRESPVDTTPTARELADIDFIQRIESVEKTLACEWVNPSKLVLDAKKRAEFQELLRSARRKIDDSDLAKLKAWAAYIQTRHGSAIPFPSREGIPAYERRLKQENPPGAIIAHTSDGRGNDAYILINWGDSADFDQARLHSGQTKLEAIRDLKSFLASQH
jgi:hypothetical protein